MLFWGVKVRWIVCCVLGLLGVLRACGADLGLLFDYFGLWCLFMKYFVGELDEYNIVVEC